MTTLFDDSDILTVAALLPFLDATEVFVIAATCTPPERAVWIRKRLQRFHYRTLNRREKGILLRYLCTMTGCSRRMVQKHIHAFISGKTLCVPYTRRRFTVRYTNLDRELLAEIDNLHGRLNGAATRRIIEREYQRGDHGSVKYSV